MAILIAKNWVPSFMQKDDLHQEEFKLIVAFIAAGTGINYTTFKATFVFNIFCLFPLMILGWKFILEQRNDPYSGGP
jgi:hypothetical protein